MKATTIYSDDGSHFFLEFDNVRITLTRDKWFDLENHVNSMINNNEKEYKK